MNRRSFLAALAGAPLAPAASADVCTSSHSNLATQDLTFEALSEAYERLRRSSIVPARLYYVDHQGIWEDAGTAERLHLISRSLRSASPQYAVIEERYAPIATLPES